MLDPSKLSDEEIDRLLSSPSGGQAQFDPSSLSDEQIDAMLSQNQPMGQMGQPTPPPSSSSQMPGVSAPKAGEGGFSDYMKSYLDATLGKDYRTAKEVAGTVGALGAGGLKGLLGLGRGAGEYESKLVDMLTGSKLAGRAPQVQLPQSLEKFMGRHPIASGVGEFAAPMAVAAALPIGKVGALERGAEYLPKGLQTIGKFASRAAPQAGMTALEAPAFAQDQDIKTTMKEGGLLGLLGPIAEGVTGIGGDLFNYIRKSGGMATKKGAESAIKAADNLNLKLPAAEVLKSKSLKTLQNTLGSIPGTGMTQSYNDLSVGINQQIEGLLNDLNPENIHSGEAVQDYLSDKFKSVSEKATDIYSDMRSEITDKAPGLIHENNGLFGKAKEIGEEFSRKLKQPGGSSKIPSDVRDFISEVKDENYSLIDATEVDENINSLIGNNIADIKKGGREGQDAKRAIGYLKKLKESNNADIDKTIDRINIPEISSIRKLAKDHYKKEMVPFIEKGSKLHEIIEEQNPDKVQSKFLTKSGEQPKDFILRKVTDQLPQDIKNKISHKYLIGAKEDPSKVVGRFDSLQPRQKDALFDPSIREKLESMSALKKHFGSEFNQMFSPKTGYIAKSLITPAIAGYGYHEGGYPGAALALGGAALGGGAAKKLLMSDALKKQFLKAAEKEFTSPSLSRASLMGLPLLGNNRNK